MRCSQFLVLNDGMLRCNTPIASGPHMTVGKVDAPPRGLNATQRRQIDEWKEIKTTASQIADYFEVDSYGLGDILVLISFTGPWGIEPIYNKIRSSVGGIVDRLILAGFDAEMQRWPILRHEPSWYEGKQRLTLEELYREHKGIIVGKEPDIVWKLMFSLGAGDDIAGVLGFVADEIEERTISEHILFQE